VDVLETQLVNIRHVFDFNRIILDPCNKYAWPGGYPCYFVMSDGEALSWDAAVENAAEIRDAIIANDRSGWRAVALDINWEDNDLICCHTGNKIECAYPSDDEDTSDREHCTRCNNQLAESQIGLCDSCQEDDQ
jgi:hypothetical protein